MVNSKPIEESNLRSAFESGYSNAAVSLSKFVHDKITGSSFQHGVYACSSESLLKLPFFGRTGNTILLTTEVFGDITGKSYLLLSDEDISVLTRSIYGNGNRQDHLKDEFLKELDNILSASVITKLSNELKLKLYGDIPILVGRTGSDISSIIIDDFAEQMEQVYISAAYFTFESYPTATPFFVWAMDGNLSTVVEEKLLVRRVS